MIYYDVLQYIMRLTTFWGFCRVLAVAMLVTSKPFLNKHPENVFWVRVLKDSAYPSHESLSLLVPPRNDPNQNMHSSNTLDQSPYPRSRSLNGLVWVHSIALSKHNYRKGVWPNLHIRRSFAKIRKVNELRRGKTGSLGNSDLWQARHPKAEL